MLRVAVIVFLLSLFSACSDKEVCDRLFDTPFIAEEGGEYCFPDGSKLSISAINTSYCPCDAVCSWAGETVVVGTWTHITLEISKIMIHEVLQDQNAPWTTIHDLTLSEACEPEVTNIELIIKDPSTTVVCDESTIIDEDLYKDGPNDFVKITEAFVIGNCLNVSYSASGCSGDSWEVNLYDSGSVAESEPEQRYLRLSMNNPEACLAVFEKSRSFDISNLQIENNGTLILNLLDYEEPIRYEY